MPTHPEQRTFPTSCSKAFLQRPNPHNKAKSYSSIPNTFADMIHGDQMIILVNFTLNWLFLKIQIP